MRVIRASLLSGLLLILFSGCFDNESVPPAPCYPVLYREVSSSGTYEETYTYLRNNKLESANVYRSSSPSSSSSLDYTYDDAGRLRTITDSRVGSSTSYSYTNGQIATAIVTSGSGQTTSKQEYAYNNHGQLVTRQTYGLVNGTLTKGAYYTYEYPNQSTRNYNKRSFFNSAGTLQSTIGYTYDDQKNPDLALGIFPSTTTNNIIRYVFTPAGAGATSTTYNYDFSYTDEGYPTTARITIGNVTTTITYAYNNCATF